MAVQSLVAPGIYLFFSTVQIWPGVTLQLPSPGTTSPIISDNCRACDERFGIAGQRVVASGAVFLCILP